MILMNILSFCIFVDATLTAAILTNKQIKLESKNSNDDFISNKVSGSFKPNIISDKKRVMCKNDQCDLISNFSAPEKFHFNCHDKLLPIEFESNNYVFTAFIDSSSSEVKQKQEHSAACLNIIYYYFILSLFQYTIDTP